ncbi:hypothetical protein [Sphingobium sp.]|nr:hypothetical protein [Sphingobium sp.]
MSTIERAARAMYETVQPKWAWNDPDAELFAPHVQIALAAHG